MTPAQETLFHEHWPATQTVARAVWRGLGFVRRVVEAEDICQMAAIGLMDAIQSYEADKSPKFWQYAHPILVYRIEDQLRSMRYRARSTRHGRGAIALQFDGMGEMGMAAGNSDVLAELIAEETADRRQKAVCTAALTFSQRLVLDGLRHGRALESIRRDLGVSTSTVYSLRVTAAACIRQTSLRLAA